MPEMRNVTLYVPGERMGNIERVDCSRLVVGDAEAGLRIEYVEQGRRKHVVRWLRNPWLRVADRVHAIDPDGMYQAAGNGNATRVMRYRPFAGEWKQEFDRRRERERMPLVYAVGAR